MPPAGKEKGIKNKPGIAAGLMFVVKACSGVHFFLFKNMLHLRDHLVPGKLA